MASPEGLEAAVAGGVVLGWPWALCAPLCPLSVTEGG